MSPLHTVGLRLLTPARPFPANSDSRTMAQANTLEQETKWLFDAQNFKKKM
jgi:hypothetical protein